MARSFSTKLKKLSEFAARNGVRLRFDVCRMRRPKRNDDQAARCGDLRVSPQLLALNSRKPFIQQQLHTGCALWVRPITRPQLLPANCIRIWRDQEKSGLTLHLSGTNHSYAGTYR